MAYPTYMDYLTASMRGLDKHTYVHKFGRQTDISTTAQTVWSGNTAYTYLSAADNLIIASDFTTDGTAGSGALTVEVEGVDTDYKYIVNTITMKGFVAATTPSEFLRVFRMKVTSSGANDTNNGKICILPDAAGNTFTAVGVPTTTSNILAQIDTATSQTLMTNYTVPVTYTAYMTRHLMSAGVTNKTVFCELYVRPYGEAFQIKDSFVLEQTNIAEDFRLPYRIEPRSDIEYRVYGSSSSGKISVSYSLLLTQGD
jgi:hypothetical protein